MVASTTTDADGDYQFYLLAPGDFTIQVDPPTGGTVSWDPDGPYSTEDPEQGDNKANISVPALGVSVLDQDFGYFFTGTVAGRVWDDRDGDQAQDPAEGGISGVTVQLLQGATVFQTSTTDADGNYLFTSVGPANWTVALPSPPDGVPPTVQTFDVDGTGTAHQSTFGLQYGEFRTGEDFGYRYQAQVAGSIWDDDNEDGVESGEDPLEGLVVTLKQGANTVLVTSTDASGDYSFQYLPAGTYDVVVTPIPGTRQIYDLDCPAPPLGAACGAGSLGHQTSITLTPGQSVAAVDFSYNRAPAIGGMVWDDVDADGVLDPGETGIENVEVALLDSGGTPLSTQLTGPDGEYEFLDLTGSTDYTVLLNECTLPINSRRSTNQNPIDFSLGAEEIVDNAHVGYQPLTFPFFEGFEGALVHTTTYGGAGATCLPGAAHFGFETTSYDDASCSNGQGFYCLQTGTPGTGAGPTGRLRLNSDDLGGSPYVKNGQASASLDETDSNSPGNQTVNELIFRADLTGHTTAETLLLDFSFIDHADQEEYGPAPTWVDGDHLLVDVPGETEIVDVVDVRVGSMPAGEWIEVYRFDLNNYGLWIDIQDLNLSQAIESALGSTAFDSGFELRFRQFGRFAIGSDGLTLDDLLLRWGSGSSGIGDQVWRDTNGNASFDSGEGMPCVLVDLFDDANGNGVLDGSEGDTPLRSTRTDAQGQYSFTYLGADQVSGGAAAGLPAHRPRGRWRSPPAGQPRWNGDRYRGHRAAGRGSAAVLPGLRDCRGRQLHRDRALSRESARLPFRDGPETAADDRARGTSAGQLRLLRYACGHHRCLQHQSDQRWEPHPRLDLSFYETSQDITLDFWWMQHCSFDTAQYCASQDLFLRVGSWQRERPVVGAALRHGLAAVQRQLLAGTPPFPRGVGAFAGDRCLGGLSAAGSSSPRHSRCASTGRDGKDPVDDLQPGHDHR